AALLWQSGVAGSGAVAAFSFTALIAACGLLSFETRISAAQQTVARVWRLAGLIPLWRRTYSFDCVRGVQQLWVAEGEHDMWRVGLVTESEKFLMVTYFSSRNLAQPAAVAERFQV